jgi:hypothetical protein
MADNEEEEKALEAEDDADDDIPDDVDDEEDNDTGAARYELEPSPLRPALIV